MADEALDQPEPDGYSLIFPFIVTQSHGGPFEDESFVAGYECGRFDRSLAVIAASDGSGLSLTVHAANVKQLELIAMHHGFNLVADQSEEFPDWTFVTAERAS